MRLSAASESAVDSDGRSYPCAAPHPWRVKPQAETAARNRSPRVNTRPRTGGAPAPAAAPGRNGPSVFSSNSPRVRVSMICWIRDGFGRCYRGAAELEPRAGNVGLGNQFLGMEHDRPLVHDVCGRPLAQQYTGLDPRRDAHSRRIPGAHRGGLAHGSLRRPRHVHRDLAGLDRPGARRRCGRQRRLLPSVARLRLLPRYRRNDLRSGYPVRQQLVRGVQAGLRDRRLRSRHGGDCPVRVLPSAVRRVVRAAGNPRHRRRGACRHGRGVLPRDA